MCVYQSFASAQDALAQRISKHQILRWCVSILATNIMYNVDAQISFIYSICHSYIESATALSDTCIHLQFICMNISPVLSCFWRDKRTQKQMHIMHVTTMTIAMTTSSRAPIKLPTMMAMSMLLSSDSAAVVSVVVPSGEKQDFNYVSFLLITPTAT